MFAAVVAVPLSMSVALARLPSLGRHPEPDELLDPGAMRVDELIATNRAREDRQWSSELRQRLDRPLGEEPAAARVHRSVRHGAMAPAMVLLLRRWLDTQ